MLEQQVYFTARELAEIAKKRGLKNFPWSESAVQRLAKREGWNDLPVDRCRKRTGRRGGGGLEYHSCILPDDMQMAIDLLDTQAQQRRAQAVQEEVDRGQLVKRGATTLNARHRTVMQYRSNVLLAIERYKIQRGHTLGHAIRDFVAAQKSYLAWEAAETARDQGEELSLAQVMLLGTEPLLNAADGFGLTTDALIIANDRPRDSIKISRSTLYEWFKARKQGGISMLAPAPTKEVKPLPDGFATFLKYYAKPQKPDITEALKEYEKHHPDQPLTINQVRYTLKTKLNNIERNVGREGLLTLRSRLAYIQRSTENLFPTTIYTADGKTFDAEIADPKSNRPMKPELTSILDVATRKCVGWAVSRKENTVAVTEALRNACSVHGICAIFYTDRGAGYKNKVMDADVGGLMGRLSITKMHALPRNSQAKGIIERFNRTAWNPLAQKLPTYLGKGMDKEASEKAHKKTRADIKEFGFSRLLPTWQDFHAMCGEAVDEYNAAPHSGLPKFEDPITGRVRHMSPNEAWDAHVQNGFEPVLVEDELKDDLFRPYVIRIARRGIVEWNTNKFFHNALEAYHGEQVLVGYDDTQANYVWVREVDRETGQPGLLICVADFAGNKVDYIPRTMQQAAENTRIEGRLRRIGKKVDDIEAERTAAQFIEHKKPAHQYLDYGLEVEREAVPLKLVEPDPAPTPRQITAEAAPENTLANITPAKPRRRTFASDEELAFWALKNPKEVSAGQIKFLTDCMKRDTVRGLFRMHGIDLEALAALLRAAA
jgi:putative transposase